jgi:predicted transcriptional regulator
LGTLRRLYKSNVIDIISRTLDALEAAGKIDGKSTELIVETAGVVIDGLLKEGRIILNASEALPSHVTLRERQAAAKVAVTAEDVPGSGVEREGPEIIMRIEDSVTDDLIYCLFDGVGRKMITRHILARYNMTWPQYLEYCNLPADYPRVAPKYSDEHSKSVSKVMNASEVDEAQAWARRAEAVLRKKRKQAESATFGLTAEKQRKARTENAS